MVAALSCAARLGILIKNVVQLEFARSLTAVIFDKTGTLTEGKPRLDSIVIGPGGLRYGDDEMLRLAASLERDSEHPLAQAILEAAQPSIVIPMHYRLGDLETEADAPSDLGDIDPWLDGRSGVRQVGGHVTTLRAAELPTERTYLVFDHAPYVSGPGGF